LAIDKRKSIAQLKQVLEPLVGVVASEFKVCKGMLAKEFKDETKSLHDSGLFDGSAIVLIKGKPIAPSDFAIKVFLYNEGEEVQTYPLSAIPELNLCFCSAGEAISRNFQSTDCS